MKDIEDEIPFEVPEGWAWCRLGEIVEVLDSQRKPITKSERKSGIYPYYGATCIQDYVSDYLFDEDLLLLGEDGAKWGAGDLSAFCISGKTWVNNHAHVLRPKNGINIQYLCNTLIILDLSDFITGTTVPKLNQEKMSQILIPLPSTLEQNKINLLIKTIITSIDEIEKNRTELQTSIKQTKSKILDLAIHGKLVPQDPNDEPASVLLERLREEKEAKIKAGELKRDKNDSYIYKNTTDNCYYEKFNGKEAVCIDEEIPFDIPEGWAWCRLGSYLDVRDGTHDSPKYVEKGYPFVTSKNLVDGKIDFSSVKYISEKDHNDFIKRSLVEDGDILFAMIGSIGNPVLVKKDREFSIKNVALFKPYNKENTFMEYVLYFLIFIQESLRVQAKGGMQPFIPLSFFRKDLLIPLPPISEQKRIVSKVEEIFERLDQIQSNLI